MSLLSRVILVGVPFVVRPLRTGYPFVVYSLHRAVTDRACADRCVHVQTDRTYHLLE